MATATRRRRLVRDFAPGIYVDDVARGYANLPNYPGVYYEDVPVRTNSLGFRGPEPAADADAALRVLCLVLGWLGNDLVPASTFVGEGHLVERAEDRGKVQEAIERRWYEASYLARVVSITVRTLKHHATADRASRSGAMPEEELARSVALVTELQRETKAFGGELWVVAYVNQPAVERGVRDPIVDDFLARTRAAGIRRLDAYELFRAEHERSGAPLYAARDRVHPSALGHLVVARAVADELRAAPTARRE